MSSNKRKNSGSEGDGSVNERPSKSLNSEEPKTKENDGNDKKSETPRKTFAQSFAHLKNTDLYKLPEVPAAAPPAAPKNTNAIIVNSRQRGNPVLKFIKNVPLEYGDIIPDYQLGERHCAFFLSLRYHNLNPNYIHERLSSLGERFDLRVILVQVDIKNCKHNLKELSKISMLAGCTLILAWSAEEAGRYLETYKQYENKPPDILQERIEGDYFSQVQDLLTTVKSINKTDAITLISAFGSLKNVVNASKEEIVLCPGFGEQKARRLQKVFNDPFKRCMANTSSSEEKSLLCDKDGKLPSTCKLKRPDDINITVRKSESQSPEIENENASSTLSSPLKQSNIFISFNERCNESTPARSTDTSKINQKSVQNDLPAKTSSKKSVLSVKSPSKKKVEHEKSVNRSHTSSKLTTPIKMNKTEAVYNSGLSRNRKEDGDSRTAKSSQQKTRDKHYEERYSKSDNSPVKSTSTHNDNHHRDDKHSQSDQSQNKYEKHDKHRRKSHKHHSSRKSRDSSRSSHHTTNSHSKNGKHTHSSSASNKGSSRALTANKDILLQKKGSGGKFRVGTRKKISDHDNAPKKPKDSLYSTQITNDEFNDLIASDDDEDDIDIYADIL